MDANSREDLMIEILKRVKPGLFDSPNGILLNIREDLDFIHITNVEFRDTWEQMKSLGYIVPNPNYSDRARHSINPEKDVLEKLLEKQKLRNPITHLDDLLKHKILSFLNDNSSGRYKRATLSNKVDIPLEDLDYLTIEMVEDGAILKAFDFEDGFIVCLAPKGAGMFKRDFYLKPRETSTMKIDNSIKASGHAKVAVNSNLNESMNDNEDDGEMKVIAKKANILSKRNIRVAIIGIIILGAISIAIYLLQ